jgi:hypothetical protein
MTAVDVEEIESTRSEKLLAVVLTVFLLIGAVWAYAKLDDVARSAIDNARGPTQSERGAVILLDRAQGNLRQVNAEKRRTLEALNVRREEYRTALDANRPAAKLERRYVRAQAAYDVAVRQQERAEARLAAVQPAADEAVRKQADRHDAVARKRALLGFGLRLAFLLGLIALGYWLLAHVRRQSPRYLPLAGALVAAAAVMALVFAGDYLTDYIDPLDLGPLVLSLFGVAATVGAFVALQRYLARRVPVRRVRKGECPFCGFPVRGSGPHCENCGREVVAACAACEAPRRVGTPRCATCGNV